jgi:hypothetical protein
MEIGTLDIVATAEPVAEMDRLGDEIAELSAHLDAATAHLLDLIREFDARGGWNNGSRSCAHWLAWRVGMDLGAARERVRVARALGSLPRLAEALARGELSYAKVRAPYCTSWLRWSVKSLLALSRPGRIEARRFVEPLRSMVRSARVGLEQTGRVPLVDG